jgi:methionyl-tRNA formyltransferase
VIAEPASRTRRRIRREIQRVGLWRFIDVLAFRIHYALATAHADQAWERRALERLRASFPERPQSPEIEVDSPNSDRAERFIRERQPDLVIARCKTLIKEQVFSIPRFGTFVMHPGICPEYRNAHGCFWARVTGDDDNIGMTLLRIDRGVDTGPVFAYFRIAPDLRESHVVTQHRVVLDRLDGIRDVLTTIADGTAQAIDTRGRRSAAWGHPWLTAYLRMRFRSRAERPALQS